MWLLHPSWFVSNFRNLQFSTFTIENFSKTSWLLFLKHTWYLKQRKPCNLRITFSLSTVRFHCHFKTLNNLINVQINKINELELTENVKSTNKKSFWWQLNSVMIIQSLGCFIVIFTIDIIKTTTTQKEKSGNCFF